MRKPKYPGQLLKKANAKKHHKNIAGALNAARAGNGITAYRKSGDALKSGNYHQLAQNFINSAKSQGMKVSAEDTGELNAHYKKHKKKKRK